MNEEIELTLESADGTIDCRLEQEENDNGSFYAVTILYPTKVNGYERSDIFCHNMLRNASTGAYSFDRNEDIHPKIKRLEAQLAAAIASHRA